MISILTPSRGRPKRYERFAESVMSNADGEVELLTYVDSDDPTCTEYPKDVYVGPKQPSVGCCWNYLAEVADGDVLIMGNDDLVYRTEGWDTILLDQLSGFSDKIYCAYFNDGINGKKHCAFPIISRKWFETVGRFVPECFRFFCHDTWVMDVARKIDRLHYIPEVFIEHEHFTNKKAPKDKTYTMNRGNNTSRHDLNTLRDTENERVIEANKLREVMV